MNHLQRHFSKNRAILCYDRPSKANRAAPTAPVNWGRDGSRSPHFRLRSNARTKPVFRAPPPVSATSGRIPIRRVNPVILRATES